MGEVTKPKPVKLFVGILIARLPLLSQLCQSLEERFGAIELSSDVMNFNFTKYYEPEMGPGLKRQFVGFRDLVSPDDLPEIKLFTNSLEKKLAERGRRLVNLDPGYLTGAKVVLVTTKDFAHRLYLGCGIYGEVTMLFQRGRFTPLPWTYPDYRSESYHRFFRELRDRYMLQLKSAR
jgi:hypothetical protein